MKLFIAGLIILLVGCATDTTVDWQPEDTIIGHPTIHKGIVTGSWHTNVTNVMTKEREAVTVVEWAGYSEVLPGTHRPVIGECYSLHRSDVRGMYLKECDL